ncbi:MAG TPA: STAS domain-containing protein [Candidatus Ozemobacteraceae bacterium]|nr:STAS domain-containing protein [Candidatus Ozemobacteraceae bacterium]
MVQKFSFTPRREGEVLVLSVNGYLEGTGGATLKSDVELSLQQGITRYVIDFSGVELISSPGVAALLDIASRVIDDNDGRLAVYGLDKHHSAVLEMSGFFYLATEKGDAASALAAAIE